MVLASASLITFVPRFWRMYLAEWLISLCRLPATPALILPVAVILKRFLAPDLVFSLGISHRRPIKGAVLFESRINEPPWHAFWPGGSNEGAVLKQTGRQGKVGGRNPPPSSLPFWGGSVRRTGVGLFGIAPG